MQFCGNSTAVHGTFVVNGATDAQSGGGNLVFREAATAGSGTFTLNEDSSGEANPSILYRLRERDWVGFISVLRR